ncbi:DNA polymerase ligase N-terminal domain-containing protein [Streptomyces sp. NPDC046976]|uniref:DNA polymerase ligase N-terminal domain-containing protein n=1 Tax=Streptomyces sp. NPDC046976 TaxID=3155258 RepID=UPI0033DCD67B
MAAENRLRTYRGRRDFERTREPAADGRERASEGPEPSAGQDAGSGGGRPRFVVQIHDARRMHFDFRLQVADVLKSWSVPRGPSADPGDKRLAVPTEDHPLAYEDFEGVIPKGEYGGGTVIVWDRGTYEPLSHDRQGRPVDFAESLKRGHATFRLHGTKLHGEYALTRFRGRDGEDHWLLVRKGAAHRAGHGSPDPRRARSVRTGRTLAQVAAGGAR